MIIETNAAIGDLENVVREMSSSGFGIACMYVKEGSYDVVRSLEVIMVSDKEVTKISSHIPENVYPALTPHFPAANIYEREISEMSGILPLGHSDLRPLKLRTIRDGSYPMQKTERTEGTSRPVLLPMNGMFGEGLFEIPVGPIHAGVIGPGHFRFSVAGEPILMLRTYLGYTHRGIEKMMETPVRKDNTKLVERISGDNAIAHCLAYLQVIEGDADIPPRALYVRMIYAELERIYYMLGGIAGIATDTALTVPAAKGYVLKERVLRLNERISGHRLLWGNLRPGGLREDMSSASMAEIEREIVHLRFEVDELFGSLTASPSFMDRVDNTGILTKEDAVRLRTVGPTARASGVEYDVRKNHPYAAYKMIGMKIPVHTSGDVYARLKVKKDEVLESISIIAQCLSSMEPGDVLCKIKTEDGFRIGMTESPRGEVIHCAHVLKGNIWRYKVRDPSFPNWPALELAALGNIIPDFPLVNKSFDLSYSGNDL
ncbi:MAG: NADH-quinone oxidoreductase subunit C [Methanomassiliicoccaceae archaeon]|jgi:Ni,Fe-hydrogenase III large subunit/Ni,Fe-hydrogenase III component G|nr:NADH-quinone oxidoreductase subunit C [Methanomassiliicoccaceae archaeon]